MKDGLIILENVRRPHFSNGRRTQFLKRRRSNFLKMKVNLNFFEMEDDFIKNNATKFQMEDDLNLLGKRKTTSNYIKIARLR